MKVNLTLICLAVWHVTTAAAQSSKSSRKSTTGLTLSSGVDVAFTDKASRGQLSEWAVALDGAGGSVSHGEAVYREQYVVHQVQSGAWSPAAYEEYQTLASSTGNVDSARLLLEYGVAQSVGGVMGDPEAAPLHHAAVICDTDRLQALLDEGAFVDMPLADGTTALHAAALNGCSKAVLILVAEEADVEAMAANGATPLMVASAAGHVKSIRALVKAGAKVGARHKFAGTTALHMAAETGKPKSVKALCKEGADPSATTITGGTPLHTAADANAVKAVAALLSPPCNADAELLMNNDTTALYLAAQHGYVEMVEALLANGAQPTPVMPMAAYRGDKFLQASGDQDPLASFVPNAEPGNGATPLHAAAENGHEKAALALIDGGAAIDSASMMGVTPLHLAAQYNRPNVIQVLCDAGAAVELRAASDGATALYYASGSGFDEAVKVLLSCGADVNEGQRRMGGTPLIYAAGTGRRKVVKYLLDAGAAVNRPAAKDRLTPLLAAVSIGNVAVVKLLLRKGADVTYKGEDGQTALHLAATAEDASLTEALLARGSDLEARVTSSGATALHLASQAGNVGVISLLTRAGADVSSAMNERMHGATPLYAAAGVSGNRAAVEALLEAGADPDQSLTSSGATVLLNAVERGDHVTASLVLDHGADSAKGSATSSIHQAPLLLAVVRGKTKVAETLLEHGAFCGIMVATRQGAPPENLIGIARQRRDFDMMQLLTSHEGCDVSYDENVA